MGGEPKSRAPKSRAPNDGNCLTGEPPPWLTVARAAKGFMPDDEGMALHRAGLVAGRSGLGPLLEIGTYCGKSAVYLGAAARADGACAFQRRPSPRFGGTAGRAGLHHDPDVVDRATGQIDTLPWARLTLRDAGLEDDVVLVVGESVAAARGWPGPLSLLFIDGGHGEEVAWADYRAWADKVALGGTLAIHDVFADPKDGGQVPYDIYCAALRSGEFEDAAATGSLRVLRRR